MASLLKLSVVKSFASLVPLSTGRLIPQFRPAIPHSDSPWVGCSHWSTPYRPRFNSSLPVCKNKDEHDTAALAERQDDIEILNVGQDSIEVENSSYEEELEPGIEIEEGIQVYGPAEHNASARPDSRPRLPSSVKKLNRLLSHQTTMHIPESDLLEAFVRGRGPGGQAINKTSSSVSLTHIPTGIRIQAQPTRSREQNRKAARDILRERLDILRSRELAQIPREPQETEKGSRKEREREVASAWSKAEIRWEKERRRKLNRAKKTKRKKREGGDEGQEPVSESESSADVDEGVRAV